MTSALRELAGQLAAAADRIPHDVAAALTSQFDETIALCEGLVAGSGHESVIARLKAIREHLAGEIAEKLGEARQALTETAENIVRGG